MLTDNTTHRYFFSDMACPVERTSFKGSVTQGITVHIHKVHTIVSLCKNWSEDEVLKNGKTWPF